MIKAIAVDDEYYNLEEICDLVDSTGFIKIEGKYMNPKLALAEVSKISPQVAFIDIEMPEIDGITLAEKILEERPSTVIVFITASDKHAIEAFEINALDYIVKPVNPTRFNRMADRLQEELGKKKIIQINSLKICSFTSFGAKINDIPVRWNRLKAEELFAFLLMNNGQYIHKGIIIDNLWPDYDPIKALPILQTSVCKIRNLFSELKDKVILDYCGNKYCLSLQDVACDYIETEEAIRNYKSNNKSTFAAIEKACALYGEGFLAQQGYLWSLEKNEELRRKLVTILNEIGLAYAAENNVTMLINIIENLEKMEYYIDDTDNKLIQEFNRIKKRNLDHEY